MKRKMPPRKLASHQFLDCWQRWGVVAEATPGLTEEACYCRLACNGTETVAHRGTVDCTLGKSSSESAEGLVGRLGAPRTAKALRISVYGAKSQRARKTGTWGQLSDEGRDSTTRPERGPLGYGGRLGSRTAAWWRPTRSGLRTAHTGPVRPCEGWMQTVARTVYVGERLKPNSAPGRPN